MGVGAKMAKEPWGGPGLSFPALPLGLCRPAAAAVAAPLPMPRTVSGEFLFPALSHSWTG